MPSGLEAFREFDSLRIKFASPEIIKGWSYGEVTKPETINYRTFKAEKDGLFDERIFGPTKDYECYCGKYKKARFKGIICDKCGVEVTSKRVRRERMGHISLASPVAHIWFFRGVPSMVSILLGISSRDVEGVIYFSRYLITEFDREKRGPVLEKFEHDLNQQIKQEQDPANKIKLSDTKREGLEVLKSVKLFSVLSEREVELALPYLKEFSEVMMGAEAIRRALALVDLGKISLQLRKVVHESKGERGVWARRRLRIVEGLKNAGVEPAWFILTVLPVIPPDLRPMVQLEGGRFATSDLNDLYRTVINRNNRLRQLLELGAPEIIVRNEKRMLQEAVDALIDSSKARRGKVRRGKKTLRSFADLLSGKQGRFRQNLLGKRVDYSGRSVIVVGPYLKLNQVGIPREMALELWKPHVLREILLRGSASNLRSAKAYLEERSDEVWEILEQLVVDHPVLLNRAPSLHRLSILGFYPVLVSGSAIQLHPNVCSGFGADFDGDAMAVHLPITKQAIQEVKDLMISKKNLLRPATGDPITYPSKEQVLGTFYLTSTNAGEESADKKNVFVNEEELILRYELGKIGLRELVKVVVDGKLISTTVGRVIFNRVLPESLRFFNSPAGAKEVRNFVAQTIEKEGEDKASDLIDAIKNLGFRYATQSGISISVSDGVVPAEKPKVLAEAEEKIAENDRNFKRGLITDGERRNIAKVVWSEATAALDDLAWNALGPENPIRVIIASGAARASRDQVKQISGMRGQVVDPTGRIVELPIRSNYREGLTSFEYFVGARGARKGLVDTALRTADAGYLTRRLVDVAQDVLVREEDCGTKESITLSKSEETLLVTFARRLLGRVTAQDIKVRGKTIINRNALINAEAAKEVEEAGITEVNLRSPLTCASLYGICAACYGLDLGRNKPVEVGTPVGLIAAQSIGEPGTQMTLRTKHAGGIAASVDITQGLPRVEEVFEARTPKFEAIMAEFPGKVKVVEEGELHKIFLTGDEKNQIQEYDVPAGRWVMVADGDKVAAGAQLTDGYLDPKKVLRLLGVLATQKYLVNENLKVYSGQGVALDDVHLETIVRQMFNKVRIKDSGNTHFIPEEVVTRTQFEAENRRVPKGGKKATGEVVLLGITKSSLKTDSWLSAASFQETTRILTEAAVSGKVDHLLGLKENVIIGRLIPTGERARLKDGRKIRK